jgi:hypothetical protein
MALFPSVLRTSNEAKMKHFVVLAAALLARIGATRPPRPPKGAAAWVYDVNGGQPAMWSGDIAAFNAAARQPINVIWSYGGDMEYYPGTPNPYNTYFGAANQQEASIYQQTPGVAYVVTVIDGRMDGGESWSPDLSKLNTSQV